MTPEEYQQLLNAGWTPQEIYQTFGERPPGEYNSTSVQQSTLAPVASSATTQEAPAGVPAWLWDAYLKAQEEYNAALEVFNSYSPEEQLGEFGLYRLTNAQRNLNSLGNQLDNFKATATKPGANNYRVGNMEYTYDESGIPKPIYTYPSSSSGSQELTPYQSLQSSQWERTFGYKQEQDAMDRFRQQQQDAWQRAQSITQNKISAAPTARLPGQEYYVGYEPGGIMQKLFGTAGVNYNPNNYRVATTTIDPEEEYKRQLAWQKAQGGQ